MCPHGIGEEGKGFVLVLVWALAPPTDLNAEVFCLPSVYHLLAKFAADVCL